MIPKLQSISVQKNGMLRMGPQMSATAMTPAHPTKPTYNTARYRVGSTNGKVKKAAMTKWPKPKFAVDRGRRGDSP